jgi:hypothetical protein
VIIDLEWYFNTSIANNSTNSSRINMLTTVKL